MIVALLVVAAMQTVGAEPVRARDKVSLPFTCSVDNGRLRVEPSAERSYPIVGPRDQQAFTYCPATDNGRCRTWTVHRFVVQCSGGRAMWPEIVAAAGRDHNRTSFENGQLLLRLGPRRNDTGDATCGDPAEAPNGPAARWPRCQLAGYSPPRNAQRTHTLALPRGYAPLGLINARVLVENETAPSSPQPAPSSTSSTSASPSTRAQTPLRGPDTEVAFQPAPLAPAVVPKQLAREVVNEALEAPQMPLVAETSLAPVPLPQVELRPEQPLPAIPIGWTPWIEMAAAIVPREEPAAPPPADPMIRLFAMMLAATGLLAATGALFRKHFASVPWRRVERPGPAGDVDRPRAVVLRTKAEGHIALISRSLDRLTAVAPLRNALARDLQASERRLAVVIAGVSATGVDADAWLRARRRLERIAQDLDRLQQIADCAVTSLSGQRYASELPRNKEEAYASLGVTPGVSEAILKKLVEALRTSWHPDFARTDEEREARTVRITEINVAWDLITGKRESE